MYVAVALIGASFTRIYPNFNRYVAFLVLCLLLAFADGKLEPIVDDRRNLNISMHGGVAAEHSRGLRWGNAESIALTPSALVPGQHRAV